MTPKSTRRWMRAALVAAASDAVQMPWERGARREAMLTRRSAQPQTSALRPVPAQPRGMAAR